MTWIRNIGQNESNSVAVRIVRCPFTFLTFIKKKIGKFVESNIKNSFICHWARVYIQNFMAVNTRFFGIMILATVVCYSIVGMRLSKIALIVGVIGAIMSVFNFNLMSLNPSKVVSVIKSAAGFKILILNFTMKRIQMAS